MLDELTQRNSFPAMPESAAALETRVTELSQEWLRQPDWERIVFYGHGATVRGLIEALAPELEGRVPEPHHCSVTKLVQTSSGRWAPRLLSDVELLTGINDKLSTSTGAAYV